MSEENELQLDQEESKSIDMSLLRRAAKLKGIKAQPTWTKADFIDALQKDLDSQKDNAGNIVIPTDLDMGPKPGFARILIHRDPTPGHKNTPIHLGVNGMILQVPRGLEVEVPIPFVEALKNSVSAVPELVENSGDARNPSGTYKDTLRTSYPFQVLAITPGTQFHNNHDNRKSTYERRAAFEKQFGRWPTAGELNEAMKAKIIKDI